MSIKNWLNSTKTFKISRLRPRPLSTKNLKNPLPLSGEVRPPPPSPPTPSEARRQIF